MGKSSPRTKREPIKIRFKELSDGCKSIYLDCYLNGKRKYEFLKLYIHPESDKGTIRANEEAMRLAEEVRQKRLAEISNEIPSEAPASNDDAGKPVDEEAVAAQRKARIAREPVTLRAKLLANGKKSLYLDIYYKGKRSYEFLKLHLPAVGQDAGESEAILAKAEEIRKQRLEEILAKEEKPAEPEIPKKKSRRRIQAGFVRIGFRKLRNGAKSFYLHIIYGENLEKNAFELLHIFLPEGSTPEEEKKIRSKVKAIQHKREQELENGTFVPNTGEPTGAKDEEDRYKEFVAKRKSEPTIATEAVERKRSSKKKEPVRIRFKKLANGNSSVYLAININGHRTYDYLKLYLVPETDYTAKEQNRKTMEAVYAIKARRILEITNGKAGIQKRDAKMLVTDWLRIYRDRQMNRGHKSVFRWVTATLKVIEQYNAYATMGDMTKEWLNEFMNWLQGEYRTRQGNPLTKGSVNYYMRCLKSAFNVAVEENILPSNPMQFVNRSHLQQEQSTREFLTVDEIKRLIDTPCRRPELKQAFLFSCFCGLRISDVRTLKWGNVIEEEGKTHIQITQFKTKRPLSLPLNNQALAWMPKRGDAADTDNVFPDIYVNISMRALTAWVKDAGIKKHVTFHVSRHTFATMALTLGADIYTTSKLLGHSNVQITAIYAKVVNKKKEEAVSLFDTAFE